MMKDFSKEIKNYKKQVLKMLKRMNLLECADESSLQLLWDTYEMYLMCKEDIKKNGISQVGTHGMTVHPSATLMLRCTTTMINIFKEFGVTPKARQLMLCVTTEDENSPLNEFLKNVN